ncbi:unnamed protein product [Amoebophrya sp. A120]|nr:unnamed protein product [Amoebophrya sp. A120]|eukprot:GSA120T00014828001.1
MVHQPANPNYNQQGGFFCAVAVEISCPDHPHSAFATPATANTVEMFLMLDSCASKHMAGPVRVLHELVKAPAMSFSTANGPTTSTTTGSIWLETSPPIKLQNVAHVPSLGNRVLLSYPLLRRAGIPMSLDKMQFLSYAIQLVEGCTQIKLPVRINHKEPIQTAFVTCSEELMQDLWCATHDYFNSLIGFDSSLRLQFFEIDCKNLSTNEIIAEVVHNRQKRLALLAPIINDEIKEKLRILSAYLDERVVVLDGPSHHQHRTFEIKDDDVRWLASCAYSFPAPEVPPEDQSHEPEPAVSSDPTSSSAQQEDRGQDATRSASSDSENADRSELPTSDHLGSEQPKAKKKKKAKNKKRKKADQDQDQPKRTRPAKKFRRTDSTEAPAFEQISYEKICQLGACLFMPTFQKLWEIVRTLDNSQRSRSMVIHFCKHNLTRLKTHAFPHHKVGGVEANSLSDWCALDTFFPLGKEFSVLHGINIHSRASTTTTFKRAVKMQDTADFLEYLKTVGMMGKNILCDQGKEFDNIKVREWCQLYGIQLFLTPKASWVNGTCERRHRLLRAVLHRLYYVYGQKSSIIPRLVQQATNAVNMTPTAALDGLAPAQVQWVINPFKLEPNFVEDLTEQQAVLVNEQSPESDYKIRCRARALVEELKHDRQLVDETRKLRELQRNFYHESDECKVGELVEIFDKDKEAWLGPCTLIHRQVNNNSVTFVVDHDGRYRRSHASHVRRHLTATAMTFPPMLLKSLYKTHNVPDSHPDTPQGEFLDEETTIKIVPDGNAKVAPKTLDAADSIKADPKSSTDAPAASSSSASSSSREPDTLPPPGNGGPAVSLDVAPIELEKKFRLTKDYYQGVFDKLKSEEVQRVRQLIATTETAPVRGAWIKRNEQREKTLLTVRALIDAQPEYSHLKEAQKHKVASDIAERCRQLNINDINDNTLAAMLAPLICADWEPGEVCYKAIAVPDHKSGFDTTEPAWKEAISKEVKAHSHVFRPATPEEVERFKRSGSRAVPCKMLLSVKRCGKRKARIVCLGFLDKMSGNQKYATVPDLSILRMLLCMKVQSPRMFAFPSDATSAFLQAKYPVPVVIDLDQRLQNELGYRLGVVEYAMNGLRLSSRAWEDHRDAVLVKQEWKRNPIEATLWTRAGVLLLVFVDNFWFFGDKEEVLKYHEELRPALKLQPEEVRDEGTHLVYDVLGIEARENKKTGDMVLNQDKYVQKILDRFGGDTGRNTSTPMDAPPDVSAPEVPELVKTKQELTGSLQYLCQTRMDIVVALKMCARVKATPECILALKRIVRYLRTRRGLRYKNRSEKFGDRLILTAWSDSDWASFGDRKSNSGVVICLNGNAIAWRCASQNSVSSSVSEAELYGMSEAAKMVLRFHYCLESLRPFWKKFFASHSLLLPIQLGCDNSSAISYTENQNGTKSALKHIDIRGMQMRDLQEKQLIKCVYHSTKINKSNGLTKTCPPIEFRAFLELNDIIELD